MMLLLAVLIFIFAVCLYIYRSVFYMPRHNRPTSDVPLQGDQYESVAPYIYRMAHAMARYPFEAITIRSFDNTALFGRYYHKSDDAPLIILFHGYRSHPYRDCSGAHGLALRLGFNVLAVDQRAHGESGGSTITFGIRERRDCLRWAEYTSHRFGARTPIILSGLSMGAATVLMAAQLNLPDNVCCIIADSPYSAPSAIIEKVGSDRHYPVPLCKPFLHLTAWLFGGFFLNSSTARDSVRYAKIPILLLHGEDDRMVPSSMSLEIAACCASRVQLVTFPGAGHGLCYLTDPERYERVIYEFLCSIPELTDRINRDFPDLSD